MKKIDIIIAMIAVAVAGILYFSGIISPKEKGVYAVVYVDGNEYGRLPLDKDGSIDVVTEYGENKVGGYIVQGNRRIPSRKVQDYPTAVNKKQHSHGR